MKQLTKLLKTIRTQSLRRLIPYVGIFAFSGASQHALADYFIAKAQNPSPWYNIASWLVEFFTALIVGEAAKQLKIALSSIGRGITKEKKRWGWVWFGAYASLASIAILASVRANLAEFQGDVLLGSLFPSLSISCAIAANIPDIAKAREKPAVSDDSEAPPKSKPKKREGLFARCACGWQGGPYPTEKSRTNARNGHRRGECQEKWIE